VDPVDATTLKNPVMSALGVIGWCRLRWCGVRRRPVPAAHQYLVAQDGG